MAFISGNTSNKWVEQFFNGLTPEELSAGTLPNPAIIPQKLNIDITVQFYNEHQMEENGGLRTSQFVGRCLEDYPAMRKQVLLMKWILAVWDLNKTYNGKPSIN